MSIRLLTTHNHKLSTGPAYDVPDCGDDACVSETQHMRLMKSEKQRLDTYWNWPSSSSQRPVALARAGLYYTGIFDRVKCAFCQGVLKKWLPSDIPMSEHKAHFPRCPFIRGEDVGNVPIEHSSHMPHGMNTNTTNLKEEETRLKTFSGWPLHLEQTPEVLARAGFYYNGDHQKPDRVKCAYCQGKLYDWEAGDDPWVEHARYFPGCPYMILCMGEDNINDIHGAGLRNRQRVQEVSTVQQVQPNEQTTVSSTRRPASTQQTAQSEIEQAMRSSQVEAVLEVGYPRDLVREVVQSRITETGRGFSNAEELASIIMERENDSGTVVARTSHESEREAREVRTEEKSEQRTEESIALQDRYLCKVCMENQIQITFLPCGHLVCCAQCSMVLDDCPICRTKITGMVKTYY